MKTSGPKQKPKSLSSPEGRRVVVRRVGVFGAALAFAYALAEYGVGRWVEDPELRRILLTGIVGLGGALGHATDPRRNLRP